MHKNPVDGYVDNSLAAVFTMMLPGLGQMLKERVIPGIIWALLVGGGYLLNGWLGLFFHVLCILDAAFSGGLSHLLSTASIQKKCTLFIGLFALLVYTCLRTALF
jgi:TM2 domain-containing membrane protein YozV